MRWYHYKKTLNLNSPQNFDLVNNIKSNEYYVKIMVAWYYATALGKQYDSAVDHDSP